MIDDQVERYQIPDWTPGDFSTVPRFSTGSLKADLQQVLDALGAVWGALMGKIDPAWVWHPDDPMWTLHAYAAHLADLYVRLEEQGFRPPALDYFEDPMGFVERNRHFLIAISPYVTDSAVTVH